MDFFIKQIFISGLLQQIYNIVVSYAKYLLQYNLLINQMGSQQCTRCQNKMLQNNAYGDYQLFQQNGYSYAVIEKVLQKNQLIQFNIVKKLQQRKNIKQPHLVRLHKYEISQQPYAFRVVMYYQYIQKTLGDRIEELAFRGIDFSEKQLFTIIYGVQAALNTLNQHGIKHSCINTQTIICKNNFYKLTDVSSTSYITSYHLALKNNRNQFLSQKLLQALSHKSLQPVITLKDDYFSLGMIILSIATKQSADDFYQWKANNNGILKTKHIEKCLKLVQNKYSQKLAQKLYVLINMDNNQQSLSDATNLTQSFQQMSGGMIKIVNKMKKVSQDY